MIQSPINVAFARLQETLLGVEQRVALVTNFLPRNFEEQVSRAAQSLQRQEVPLPRFEYTPLQRDSLNVASTTLSATRVALSGTNFRGRLDEPIRALFSDRLIDLERDLALVRARGSTDVPALGKIRFEFDDAELGKARDVSAKWLEDPKSEPVESKRPLLPQLAEMCRRMGSDSLGIRVMERPLVGLAAAGEDSVYVRPGARASASEAKRLWVHEVFGHLLPRLRARSRPAPFSLGTRGCSEDEEGWAVFQEHQAGALSALRRCEIALRFFLADTVRERGLSSAAQEAARLVAHGEEPLAVARTLCRVFRGGGLAREVVYLPAYLRVSSALEQRREWMPLFESGRVSVRACEALNSLYPTKR